MRILIFSCCSFILLVGAVGCKKSETLTDEEQKYVKITVELAKAKTSAKDSSDLVRKQDSVYKSFGSSHQAYTQDTKAFGSETDRVPLVFRAIEDSLKD
jgi:uncharacterized protein YxeA